MNSDISRIEDLPVIDLEQFMNADPKSKEVQDLCNLVASCFHNYGILLIKDPRAQQKDNSEYIDLMEKYFESRGEMLYAGQELNDAKPECHYQVGVCPKHIEIAKPHADKIRAYSTENAPVSPLVPIPDAKWRFMWKIGERPVDSPDNFPQVIPSDFPEWESKLNKWGHKLFNAVSTVAEMTALGMGMEKNTFVRRMEGGAHLLAPTGTDLQLNGVGSIFAGFHYDIAFLTIHGKSRYPGLYVWTRKNNKMQVKVPEGCLLLQSGKSFEHITGGYIHAGFHEVVCTEGTNIAMEKALEEGRSTWRISSTMFTHFRNDTDCSPLPEVRDKVSAEQLKLY
jgi:isopenicillin N synthase-like dioxygenase